jgi:hypothetical protein
MGSHDSYWPPKKYDPFFPHKLPGPQRPLFPPQISGGNLVDKAPGSCCSTPGFEGYTLPVPGWVTAEQALNYCACILSGLLLSPGWSNLPEVIGKIEQSQDWLDFMAQATTTVTLAIAPSCLYTPSQADFDAAGVAGFKRPIYATFFAFRDSAPGPGAPGSKVVKPLGDKLVYVGHFQPAPELLECATFYEQYAKVAPDKFQPVVNPSGGLSYWWPDFYGDWVAQHAIPLDEVSVPEACPGVVCHSPKKPDPNDCSCSCPDSCPPGQMQDPNTCGCAEPPCDGLLCADGEALNPITCLCEMPVTADSCLPCTVLNEESGECAVIVADQAEQAWSVWELQQKALAMILHILTQAAWTNISEIKKQLNQPISAYPIWIRWAGNSGGVGGPSFLSSQAWGKKHGAAGVIKVACANPYGLHPSDPNDPVWHVMNLDVFSPGFEDCVASYWNITAVLENTVVPLSTEEAILFSHAGGYCSSVGSFGWIPPEFDCPV